MSFEFDGAFDVAVLHNAKSVNEWVGDVECLIFTNDNYDMEYIDTVII